MLGKGKEQSLCLPRTGSVADQKVPPRGHAAVGSPPLPQRTGGLLEGKLKSPVPGFTSAKFRIKEAGR